VDEDADIYDDADADVNDIDDNVHHIDVVADVNVDRDSNSNRDDGNLDIDNDDSDPDDNDDDDHQDRHVNVDDNQHGDSM